MTDFILVRHGETDWNRELRFQGHIDVPLNDAGLAQARRLAARLAGETIHHAVGSDLLRAVQTAAPATAELGLPHATDAALREQHFGIVDGLRVVDIQREHAEAWLQWTQFRDDYALPEGESTRDFHARVLGALRQLALAHAGRTVLVVTHGGALDIVWRTARALGLSGPRQSVIPNAGVNRVRITGERVEIVDWGDVRHLDGLPTQPVYDQARLAREHAEAMVAVPVDKLSRKA